jgi:hypothetical protein
MISLEQFERLYAALNSREDARQLAISEANVSYNGLMSILSQKHQRATKRALPGHRSKAKEYFELCSTGDVKLVDLAEEHQFAPCVLARLVLEVYVDRTRAEQPVEQSGAHARTGTTQMVTDMLRDTSRIADASLREQVDDCVRHDYTNSPMVEKLKHSVGSEYEYLLQRQLRNMRVPFLTEDDLMARGYPKTPDFKFEVPLLLDGRHAVNWIESKATFGDPDTMQTSLAGQFAGYCNRYGHGLVIYWFGFVEPQQQQQQQQQPQDELAAAPLDSVGPSVVFRSSMPRRSRWTVMQMAQ